MTSRVRIRLQNHTFMKRAGEPFLDFPNKVPHVQDTSQDKKLSTSTLKAVEYTFRNHSRWISGVGGQSLAALNLLCSLSSEDINGGKDPINVVSQLLAAYLEKDIQAYFTDVDPLIVTSCIPVGQNGSGFATVYGSLELELLIRCSREQMQDMIDCVTREVPESNNLLSGFIKYLHSLGSMNSSHLGSSDRFIIEFPQNRQFFPSSSAIKAPIGLIPQGQTIIRSDPMNMRVSFQGPSNTSTQQALQQTPNPPLPIRFILRITFTPRPSPNKNVIIPSINTLLNPSPTNLLARMGIAPLAPHAQSARFLSRYLSVYSQLSPEVTSAIMNVLFILETSNFVPRFAPSDSREENRSTSTGPNTYSSPHIMARSTIIVLCLAILMKPAARIVRGSALDGRDRKSRLPNSDPETANSNVRTDGWEESARPAVVPNLEKAAIGLMSLKSENETSNEVLGIQQQQGIVKNIVFCGVRVGLNGNLENVGVLRGDVAVGLLDKLKSSIDHSVWSEIVEGERFITSNLSVLSLVRCIFFNLAEIDWSSVVVSLRTGIIPRKDNKNANNQNNQLTNEPNKVSKHGFAFDTSPIVVENPCDCTNNMAGLVSHIEFSRLKSFAKSFVETTSCSLFPLQSSPTEKVLSTEQEIFNFITCNDKHRDSLKSLASKVTESIETMVICLLKEKHKLPSNSLPFPGQTHADYQTKHGPITLQSSAAVTAVAAGNTAGVSAKLGVTMGTQIHQPAAVISKPILIVPSTTYKPPGSGSAAILTTTATAYKPTPSTFRQFNIGSIPGGK